MEINTSLSGYGRAPLSYDTLRKSEAVQEMDSETVTRRDNALTGSSAVLSTSLASALWAVQEAQDGKQNSNSLDNSALSRIESSYFEFAN